MLFDKQNTRKKRSLELQKIKKWKFDEIASFESAEVNGRSVQTLIHDLFKCKKGQGHVFIRAERVQCVEGNASHIAKRRKSKFSGKLLMRSD